MKKIAAVSIGLLTVLVLLACLMIVGLRRDHARKDASAGVAAPPGPRVIPRVTSREEAAPATDTRERATPGAATRPFSTDDLLQLLKKRGRDGRNLFSDSGEAAKSSDVPEDNGAHYFLLASELLPDAVGDRIMALLEAARSGDPIDPTELAELLEQCQAALDAMRKGLETKNVWMPEARGGAPVPYYKKFRTLGRLMELQALSAIQQGDAGAACNAWCELIEFSNESTRGACLLGRISGNSMFDSAADDIRATLMAGTIPAEQLPAFLNRLQEIEAGRVPFAGTMDVDNAASLAWYESLLEDPERFRDILTMPEFTNDPEAIEAMAAVPNDQLQALLIDAVQAYQACSDTVSMSYYDFRRTYQEPSTDNPFAQRLLSEIEGMPGGEARAQAVRNGTLLVAALQAYHAQHGQWPENLNALAPAILREVPPDPFTGASFNYQSHADGFLLYSSGSNMQDDGGALNQYDAPNGDLAIWPTAIKLD